MCKRYYFDYIIQKIGDNSEEEKFLDGFRVADVLNTYETENNKLKEKIDVLLKEWKKVEYSGLLNLMRDYNLDWDSVYEIVKSVCEKYE